MPGFALRRRAEYGGHVVVALDVGLLREIKVTTVRLRLAREGRLEVSFRLASLQVHVVLLVQAGGVDRRFRQILTPLFGA
jgi:hypothetical protein